MSPSPIQLLLRKCENMEPPESELKHADCFSRFFEIYRPLPETEENSNGVGLANAIQMINKYCAKLPSDTFTKLTPLWRCAKTTRKGHDLYQYTIRMPINSPLKEDILVSLLARNATTTQTTDYAVLFRR